MLSAFLCFFANQKFIFPTRRIFMPVSIDRRSHPLPVSLQPMQQQVVFSEGRTFDFLPLLNAVIELPQAPTDFDNHETDVKLLESVAHFFDTLSRNFGVLFHSASRTERCVCIFIPIGRERFSHNAPVQTEEEIVSGISFHLSQHGFRLKVGEVPLGYDDGAE
jgi:hypothetical protein